MDTPDIITILNCYNNYTTFFDIDDIFNDCYKQISLEEISKYINNDSRFISINDPSSNNVFIIPEKYLFLWFTNINLNIPKILNRGQYISYSQLLYKLNSLRTSGKWEIVPNEIIDYGIQYGLLTPTTFNNFFCLPLSFIFYYYQDKLLSKFLYDTAKQFFLFLSNTEAKKRNDIINNSSTNCLNNAISLLNFKSKRNITILLYREGILTKDNVSLETIGKYYNITRERVRQIINNLWLKFNRTPESQKIIFEGLILNIIKNKGSRLIPKNEKIIQFFAKACGIPIELIPHTNYFLLGCTLKPLSKLNNILCNQKFNFNIPNISRKLSRTFYLSKEDILILSKSLYEYICKNRKKIYLVYSVLKSIGKPAHYSEVYEKYCILFPDHPISLRSIHAILDRLADGKDVVWVGIKGTYALSEWGYERPQKTLEETLSEIIQTNFNKTRNPVSLNTIFMEIYKYRKIVNKNSILLALAHNKDIIMISKNRFIPKDSYLNPEVNNDSNDINIHKGIQNFLNNKT